MDSRKKIGLNLSIILVFVLSLLSPLGANTFTLAESTTLVSANFNSGTDGFSYLDDAFRGTNQPTYASGNRITSGGYSAGALRVYLGNGDNNTINGMSGGWQVTFNLPSPETVSVSFRYRLTIDANYESDEHGQALFSLDGSLQGAGPSSSLVQISGNGNGGSDDTSGWQLYEGQFSLGSGNHTMILGGYNNKKTYNDEWTEILVDDVLVLGGNVPPTADAGPDQSVTDSDGNGSETVTLDGTASYDMDGMITSYHWSEGGMPLASGVNPDVSLGAGTHSILLTVTDDEGETGEDTVSVTVKDPSAAQEIVDRLDYANFKSVIKSLNDFGDRCQMSGCSLTSYNNAQNWLEGQLAAMGYTVERHYYTYNSSQRASTYVTKVGTVRPDQMYIVACHLDGRGGGGAADDNASGCSLLFEGARVFAQPDVETDISIRFIWWGNEEFWSQRQHVLPG